MRWESLFDDLEAQLRRDEAQNLASEVAERARAERARITLAQRLLAQEGALRVRVGSLEVVGQVADAAPQWIVLEEAAGSVLVPTAMIEWVEGLTRRAHDDSGKVLRRLGLGHALRALARDRAGVRVGVGAAVLDGTIDRVGADHVDLARHERGEWRRARSVTAVLAIPFAQVCWVRSGAGRG